jgi:hypothetical protein
MHKAFFDNTFLRRPANKPSKPALAKDKLKAKAESKS